MYEPRSNQVSTNLPYTLKELLSSSLTGEVSFPKRMTNKISLFKIQMEVGPELEIHYRGKKVGSMKGIQETSWKETWKCIPGKPDSKKRKAKPDTNLQSQR